MSDAKLFDLAVHLVPFEHQIMVTDWAMDYDDV